MGKEEEENISDDAQLIYRESMFQFAVMNVFACLKIGKLYINRFVQDYEQDFLFLLFKGYSQ